MKKILITAILALSFQSLAHAGRPLRVRCSQVNQGTAYRVNINIIQTDGTLITDFGADDGGYTKGQCDIVANKVNTLIAQKKLSDGIVIGLCYMNMNGNFNWFHVVTLSSNDVNMSRDFDRLDTQYDCTVQRDSINQDL